MNTTASLAARAKRTILLVLSILITSIINVSSTFATGTNIHPPVDSGSIWFICQGYNSSRTHKNTDALSLDLTKDPCDGSEKSNSSSAGANIFSPLPGKVYWYDNPSGAVCVNTLDGRSIALGHIDSTVKPGDVVTTNQIIGSISIPGEKANGGIAHLHLQMWSTPNCYNSNPIPFDIAHSARICGAPNMTASGPDYLRNGTWSGVSFVAESCTRISEGATGSVYRFWSDRNQRHFYTASHEEAQQVADKWPEVWNYEGIAYAADPSCSGPTVYRFWSDKLGGHFFTASAEERDAVIAKWPDIWAYEGVAYCSLEQSQQESKPVFRFWSGSKQAHFYTASVEERDAVIAKWPDIWAYEGVAYYVK